MTRFIVVPQWQGSPAARAMLLVDGAEAIAGDLPRSACTSVEVPQEAGDALGTGVRRLSAVLSTAEATRAALEQHADEQVVLVGGDCSVGLAGIAAALAQHPDLAVVWCDAHGDLHTPETSPSGAAGGMALRAAIGHGEAQLALSPAVPVERIVVVGARDLEDAESDFAAEAGLRMLPAEALDDAEVLAEAVAATGASAVYVHLDLDVLDPSAMGGITSAVPFGADPAQLVAALARLRARVPLVGATIAGFAPSSPAAAVDDLGAILRLVGAVA
ncbi:arginase family protein [Microbacterium fluvii]|uniref:Arginase family protein n=1 Tax=Microbacterium fluvii TaxID=415215 RepID=A0ABW2HAJ6_9MICO|nr:arginase family protein [Microbacterium fluvii]MCU4671514.1 arginase family protein [Microbacterium fluvii]